MRDRSSSARLQSIALRVAASLRAASRRPNRRRDTDDGAAAVPVDPAPKPLPMTGGAEAAID